MDNNKLNNVTNIFAGIQSSFNALFYSKSSEKGDVAEDESSILDCPNEYKRLCAMILNADRKWKKSTIDDNSGNNYFVKDYQFIYDNINSDLEYMQNHVNQCDEYIDKFIELKFEIRNKF